MKFIMFLFALLFLCASSLYALDKEGLMLYLPFDEGSGDVAKDASGNGNDGELQGKGKWVEGKFGKALHLSAAADYVEVPHRGNRREAAITPHKEQSFDGKRLHRLFVFLCNVFKR